MIDPNKTLFELFNKALAEKLVSTIERLYPGNKSCLLLLSKAYECLIYNPLLFQALKGSRVRLEILESINPQIYKPESNNIALLVSHHASSLKQALGVLESINIINPGRPFKIYILINPRRTYLTKLYLQASPYIELFRKVKAVIDLNLDFIPIDNDVLTLSLSLSDAEFPFAQQKSYRAWSNLYKESDYNQHVLCAEALAKLETVFGSFEAIATKGSAADRIFQLVCFSQLKKNTFLNSKSSIFSNVLLIDRAVDLITPLITQWTFQGLIDQCDGITYGTVSIPRRLINPSKEEQSADIEDLYYLIDPNDKLLDKLKDAHWSKAITIIQDTIKFLSDLRKAEGPILGSENANKTIELIKLKRFLDIHVYYRNKIESYLKLAITIETIKFEQEILYSKQPEYFERLIELIQIQLPLEIIIKLIMLTNFCLQGFTEEQYQRIFKEMIDSFGPSVFKPLLLLEKNGFLVNSEDPDSNLHLIKLNDLDLYKTKFQIINEGSNPADETDLSVCYAGYVPILIRIIENIVNPSSQGPVVKFKFSPGASKKDFVDRKSIVVFLYGGITYAELSCIRRLGRIYNKNFLVVTTEIINAKTFPKSFIQEMDIK